jgi:hypothetical protein
VADKLSHIQQCQAKATSVQDVLELLVGNRATSSTISGSSAAASAAASAAGSTVAAAVALRGCLGTAKALLKAMEASKKDMFQNWQVRHICLLSTNGGLLSQHCSSLTVDFTCIRLSAQQ